MSNLVLSREIYCPVDGVFAYGTDLTRFSEWWPNVSEVERLGEGSVVEGARYRFAYNMLGRHFAGTVTVQELVANERFVFEAAGAIHARFRVTCQATARSRTRITMLIDYEIPHVLGRALNTLFIERRNAADAEHALDQLKDVLEHEALARIDAGVVL